MTVRVDIREVLAPILVAEGLSRAYGEGQAQRWALRDVSFAIPQGRLAAIMGPSGSGKSTLLHLIGGLDTPTAGEVRIDGVALSSLGDRQRAELRRTGIGFVFQSFNLVPVLSAVENVALPGLIAGRPRREALEEARRLVDRVGLTGRYDNLPTQLSGGEQQRVALARALLMRPKVLLADEPTGALDSASADAVLALIREMHDEFGLTIILVTHDPNVASAADEVLVIRDGGLVGQFDIDELTAASDRGSRADAVAACTSGAAVAAPTVASRRRARARSQA